MSRVYSGGSMGSLNDINKSHFQQYLNQHIDENKSMYQEQIKKHKDRAEKYK